MSFQFLQTYGGDDRDVIGSWRNLIGDAVDSAVKTTRATSGDNTPISAIYRFTFETATTVSVERVSFWDNDNPLFYAGTRSVTCDSSTTNQNLLPGWDIIFAADAQAGDKFEIGVGCYFDETLGFWHRILPLGPRVAGFSSSAITLKIKNTSGGTLTDCKLLATNAMRIENDVSAIRPFIYFYQIDGTNPDADSDLNGAAITFDNVAAGETDILIDGEIIDVWDIINDEIVPGGVGLNCDDGTTVYRFADGTKYQGGVFALSSSLADTDTATIYVSDGCSSVWLSEDGTDFVPGSQGIDLTESGQATGTITSDGEVEAYLSLRPPSGATVELNARSYSLRAVGVDGSDNVLSDEVQGSFLVAQGAAPLSVRVNALQTSYYRPRYSEDPENPGEYIPDENGTHVEDQSNPGHFITLASAPSGGKYGNIWEYLEANGVTFEGI